MQSKIQVKLTHDFITKVAITCNKIADVEWSGVLIYRVTDPNVPVADLDITVVDFFPMSKNTATHTDFEYDMEFLEYMSLHNLEDCKTGLIHSHNKMGVFFSGEDLSELQDNTKLHAYYLSLIVNNNLNVCAKVAQNVECEEVWVTTNPNGKQTKSEPRKYNKVVTVDCEILYPEINKDFLDRLDEIIKVADARPVVLPPTSYVSRPISNAPASSYYARQDAWDDNYYQHKQPVGKQGQLFKEDIIDFEEFVKIYVLDVKYPNALLSTVCREYQHFRFDWDDVLDNYQEIYGKTKTFQEDVKILNRIIDLLKPYANKDINALIREIKDEIKSLNEV